MSVELDQNISETFHYLLKQLCIDQFPCGQGKWRSGNKWRCDAPDLLNPTKDHDASLESIQSLKELSELHPFINKPEWSENVPELRKMAIENPEHLTKKSIFAHFTKLRLAGMNISDIDEGLLEFKNLQELTLSANKIERVDPKNIPKKLQLLELYGNQISDIRILPKALPSLVHLGMGYNQLTAIVGAIQPNDWPNLASLDLSSNDIINLSATLETLKLLPKLSNLLLQGNPLSLSAGYRGLVIDTLKHLKVLDDIKISADEKHKYKGTSKLKGFPADDAVIDIILSSLKGLRAPQESENENGEEFPRTDYRYQLIYQFLSNATVKKNRKISDIHEKDISESGRENEDRVSCTDSDDELSQMETAETHQDYLRMRKTKEKCWSEEQIEFNHEKTLITSDLINLKNFMFDGVVLKLVENKVVVSPDPPAIPDENASYHGETEIDKNNKSGKSKPVPKDKQKPMPVQKPGGKDTKIKGKKKNKGEDLDVYELSRESKEIAETCLPLEEFISGSKNLEANIVLNPIEAINEKEVATEESKESKLSPSKQASNDLKKKGKESRKLSPNASASLQGNRSAMSTIKGGKQDKIKIKESKNLIEISETEQLQTQIELSLHVVINLRSWKTAKEAQDWINENSVFH